MAEPRSQFPDEIGPYRLIGPLGQGGMGVVYRAQHKESNQWVALKTVKVRHESLLTGIRREIRALMRVDHPGVVRILGEGVADGVPWYAMELLEGATLRDHYRRIWSGVASGDTKEMPTRSRDRQLATLEVPPDGLPIGGLLIPRSEPLPAAGGQLALALAPLTQLCETLAFLHGEGVVHRDLKPENVFIRPDGRPVLVDFGIVSQFSGSTGREVLEVGGFSTGTAGYMSPEQIHGERVDARADLYAFGCMLYEVIVGLQPFPGYTAAVLQHHLVSEPLPPSDLVFDLPPELEQLMLRLLAKRPRDRIGHASDVLSLLSRWVDVPALGGPPARAYLYRPDLLGRLEATEIVTARLDAARDGRGALILVGGESGVGKTTLAIEASRLATVRGIQVKTGECTAVAVSLDGRPAPIGVRAAPLHPLRELLQSLADRCLVDGTDAGDRLLGPRGKILAAIEPRLAQVPGATDYPDPPELPADAARRRLFTALGDTLMVLAAEKPLLVILDDLQWADELTLAWLRALAPDLSAHGLCVLGTYRVEERSAPLDELLGTPRAVLIDLKRLPPGAVAAMVREMLSLPEPPAEFVQFLVAHSDGNPFFIAEYLRAAVAGGYLLRDDAGGWHIDDRVPFSSLALPRSLRELVARRLDGLSPAARRLVEAAAVLGRAFDGDLPNQVAGLSDEEVIEALDQVVARTIFELDEGERLRFQHDKLREIAYAMIDTERLPELHHKVALALEARHRHDLPRFFPSLAHHFEAGGLDERALEYLDKSGQAALRSAAYGDAVEAFSHALRLDQSRDPRRRARWQHGMGKALFGLGDLGGAEEHTRAALEQLGNPLPWSRLEWARLLAGEAGRQVAHRLGLRRSTPPPSLKADLDEAARAASLLAHRFYYLGDSIAMITSSLLSVNLAERAELGWQVPHSYSWLGYVAGLLRLHQLAGDYFARARDGAERRHEPSELAFALTVEATGHLGCGRYAEAERCAEQALFLCDGGSDPQTLELTLTTLGHVEFYTGRVEASLRQYQTLLTSARGRDHRQHMIWGLYLQARSLLQLGRNHEAAPLLEDARRALGERPEVDSEISAFGLLSLARLRLSEHEGARRAALETLTRVERARPLGFSTVDGYDAAAETLLALGELEAARRMAAALRRLARLLPMAAPAAWLRWGQVLGRQGKRRRGRDWLERSLARAQALGMPLDQARAQAALDSR